MNMYTKQVPGKSGQKSSETATTDETAKATKSVRTVADAQRTPAWTMAWRDGLPPALRLQTKLTVSQPGDRYEQEADQVAEEVMRRTDSQTTMSDDEDEAGNSLMRKQSAELGSNAATDTSSVPPIVHDVLNGGGGQPLDTTTRAFMESHLGYDFSQVRVHTSTASAAAADSLNALAFTYDKDIHFAGNQYHPEDQRGQHLIAHEIVHTLQNSDAPIQTQLTIGATDDTAEVEADQIAYSVTHGQQIAIGRGILNHGHRVIRRFVGEEHRQLGAAGSGNAITNIDIGPPGQPDILTFGEMVALAGDFFGSLDEIKKLAGTMDGRAKLRWARWFALTEGKGPGEPQIDQKLKKQVEDRFATLAADNISHFSAGGTAKDSYETYHWQALDKAFDAGYNADSAAWDEAMTIEAFGSHFLTDMFSAGHIRVERSNIKAWYGQKFPNAVQQFITFVARHMHTFLVTQHPTADFFWQIPSVQELEQKTRDIGGPGITDFTLGDLVSLAWHDYDSQKGLKVTSAVNEAGVGPSLPFTVMGDKKLNESPATRAMAVAAVHASIEDLKKVRTIGTNMSMGGRVGVYSSLRLQATQSVKPYTAELFIPHEYAGAGNVPMNWHWGSFNQEMFDAVDSEVKGFVAQKFLDAADKQKNDTKGQITRDALHELAAHFSTNGILIIEKILGTPPRGSSPVPATP